MLVTVIDTETGKTAESTVDSAYYWTDGNGSCDCNRALMFGKDVADEQRKKLGVGENTCLDAHRFLVVAATGDLEGRTEAEFITESNGEYPTELLSRFVQVK